MRFRLSLFLFLAFSLTACGRHLFVDPALASWQQQEIYQAYGEINSRVEQKIDISFVADDDINASDTTYDAGLTCIIHVSSYQDPGPFKTAVYHEIGHCHGLGHSTNGNDIMSPSVIEFDQYDDDAIERYFKAIGG